MNWGVQSSGVLMGRKKEARQETTLMGAAIMSVGHVSWNKAARYRCAGSTLSASDVKERREGRDDDMWRRVHHVHLLAIVDIYRNHILTCLKLHYIDYIYPNI